MLPDINNKNDVSIIYNDAEVKNIKLGRLDISMKSLPQSLNASLVIKEKYKKPRDDVVQRFKRITNSLTPYESKV